MAELVKQYNNRKTMNTVVLMFCRVLYAKFYRKKKQYHEEIRIKKKIRLMKINIVVGLCCYKNNVFNINL